MTVSAPVKHSPWYLRYVFVLAFLVIVVSMMDRYVVSILVEQIKADLQLTDTQLGWLVGPAFVVIHVLFQLPLARLADHTNRRNMIALAMSLWSLCTMAAGMASPATIATGQNLSPPAMRAMTHALWTIASNLVGMGLGPLFVGVLSDRFTADYGNEAIRYALVIVSAMAMLAALAFYRGARTVSNDME
jgi:MFS family permease